MRYGRDDASELLDALVSGNRSDLDRAEGITDLHRALMKMTQEERSVLWWTACGYKAREVADRTWGVQTASRASRGFNRAMNRLVDLMNGIGDG